MHSTAVLQRELYSEPTPLSTAVETWSFTTKLNAVLSVGTNYLEEISVASNSLAVHREAKAGQDLVTVIALCYRAVEIPFDDRQS